MRTHFVNEVNAAMDGQRVTLAGWVHELRDLGGIKFIVLRDKSGFIQVTAKKNSSPQVIEVIERLGKEDSIIVEGVVKICDIAPRGIEIEPTMVKVVGRVVKPLPLELTGKVPSDIDTRLNARFLDLRRPETQAVFTVRSEILKAFRERLMEQGFQEITPPTIVASATEGGTDLFPVIYFERTAYLAQSPQLYKQLAVLGGMEKVFMTMQVFRAEKHHTTTHLNEITQMDVEIAWCDDDGAMKILEDVFCHILRSVALRCEAQLKLLKADVKPLDKIPRYTYTQVVERLNEAGVVMEWGSDFTKEQERALSRLIGDEAFFVTHWPTQIKPFYAMPCEKGDVCKAFDLMYRGLEMASGTQRIHDPELLIKQLRAKGLRPESFESYIEAFRYGPVPHAGWSLGAERLTMALTRRSNIRECTLFPRDRTRLTP